MFGILRWTRLQLTICASYPRLQGGNCVSCKLCVLRLTAVE